jgi:hypothetical protein
LDAWHAIIWHPTLTPQAVLSRGISSTQDIQTEDMAA